MGVSCFMNTGLGSSVGYYVSHFVKVEMVVCDVLSFTARVDAAVLITMRCFFVDCVLEGHKYLHPVSCGVVYIPLFGRDAWHEHPGAIAQAL